MNALIAYFDPAREGFLRRMLRLLAGLSLIPLAGLCVVTVLALRSEAGRYVMLRSLMDQGLDSVAATMAGDLVEDYPESWEYRRVQGWALRRAGRDEESLAVYAQAIEDLPEEWWPNSHLCFYSALLSDPSPYMDACDRAIELGPEKGHLPHYRRAIARMRIGDLEGALEDLELAFERWTEGRDQPQLEDARDYAEALRRGENPLDEAAIARELSRYDE